MIKAIFFAHLFHLNPLQIIHLVEMYPKAKNVSLGVDVLLGD